MHIIYTHIKFYNRFCFTLAHDPRKDGRGTFQIKVWERRENAVAASNRLAQQQEKTGGNGGSNVRQRIV